MGSIGIIDYGVGNLRSVHKALERVGADAQVLRDPAHAAASDKLILPGVGAYADGMALLAERGWTGPVRDFIATGRPLLGICLGLQLLLEGSEEDAPGPGELVGGLGLVPGRVLRFAEGQLAPARPDADGGDTLTARRLKVPHMGWNTITWDRDDPLLAGVEQGSSFYFVHSYYAQPDDPGVVTGWCDYGVRFCATLWRDNLWATQFHPEKSQAVGLRVLANFAAI